MAYRHYPGLLVRPTLLCDVPKLTMQLQHLERMPTTLQRPESGGRAGKLANQSTTSSSWRLSPGCHLRIRRAITYVLDIVPILTRRRLVTRLRHAKISEASRLGARGHEQTTSYRSLVSEVVHHSR
jgi:hypothetical protein